MSDEFDNELRDHIREVFEHYEDTTADEGWLLLREKFPEERKRRAFLWLWWGAAALLLLFMGIGLWIYQGNDQPKQIGVVPVKHHQNEIAAAPDAVNKPVAGKTIVQNSLGKPTGVKGQNSGNVIAATADSNKKNDPSRVRRVHETVGGSKSESLAAIVTSRRKVIKPSVRQGVGATVAGSTSIALVKPGLAETTKGEEETHRPSPGELELTGIPVQNKVIAKTTDTVKNTMGTDQLAAAAQATAANGVNNAAAGTQPKKTSPIMSMFDEDKRKTTGKNDEKLKDVNKSVVLGVYAATYFNYARGSSNQVNAGAGFAADIRLSDNLKLETGMAIGQNSLSYTGTSYYSSLGGLFAAAPAAANPAAYTTLGYSAASTPVLKTYDASLVGLEVPLNLKYIFNPKKNNTYFTAGFSSGTFINEQYTSKYNYPAISSPSLQQTQNQSNTASFNEFYFARTLNLAFGVGLPFGKNQLFIEPFLKYPLNGLGAQQIQFGAGGINLKFNFEPGKK